MAQHDQHRALADRLQQVVRRHLAQAPPVQVARRLRGIEVGRELPFDRQHLAGPVGGPQDRRQQLEEIDGGGIRDRHLAGPGAHQPRGLGPDPAWRIQPSAGGPGLDQLRAPVADQRLHAGGGVPGRRSQRMAREVGKVLRQVEPRAEAGQRIGRIQLAQAVQVQAPSPDLPSGRISTRR